MVCGAAVWTLGHESGHYQLMNSSVIVAKHLTKVFDRDIRAVDDLDLEVPKGIIFGLLGPNGAGKSTTIGMLTTTCIPTSGSAIVGGMARRPWICALKSGARKAASVSTR